MTKDEILKAFYLSQIAALMEQCPDIDTLDLVYRLLKDAVKAGKEDGKQ